MWLDNKDTATLKTAFNQHGRREWLLQKLYWLDAHQVCDLLSCWAMLGLLGAPHMRHVVIGALDKLRTGRVTTENSTWVSPDSHCLWWQVRFVKMFWLWLHMCTNQLD